MNTTTTHASRRRRAGARTAIGSLAAALALAAVGALPAHAAEPRSDVGDGNVSITSAATVLAGSTVRFEGTGFALATGATAGQTLSIKIDDGAVAPTGTTEGIVGTVQVGTDGTFEGTVTLPDLATIGTGQHWLRFLGSNPPVSKHTGYFTVAETLPNGPSATVTASSSARGYTTGTVVLTVAGTGFTAGETLAATVDGTAANWTSGSGSSATTSPSWTVADDGSVSNARLVFAPGALRAGSHTVVVTRSTPGADPISKDVTVLPTTSFTSLTAGSSGSLALGNLPSGATISAITLGDLAFTLPASADSSGSATVAYTIPSSATLGTQALTITQTGPAATYETTAKVSPNADPFGADAFTRVSTTKGAIAQGLYQSAYSAASDALFATVASGTTSSTIYKLDPDTLDILASTTPATVEGSTVVWAAYGVGVDDRNGTVWVTNTRQNTVAVYKQSDLSLVKQFPSGTITHSRDVVADTVLNKVFVSSASEGSSGNGAIDVYDGTTLERLTTIDTGARTTFSPVSLAIDTASHTLYSVSLTTSRALKVDVSGTDYAQTLIDLDLDTTTARASGVSYDAATNRLFVASQGTDDLTVFNASTGAKLADVATGAGALNVTHDPVNKLTYVANFAGTTVTVVDDDYTIVANLAFSRPNHVSTDGKGSVYVVNKADSNQVIKLTPKAAATGTVTITGTPAVGRQVVADVDGWSAGTALSYQWYAAGAAVKGATKQFHTIAAAEYGKKLTVKVTSSTGALSASATSTAVTVKAGTLVSALPKVTGTARAGRTVKAATGSWTSGTAFTYRWYVNGSKVPAALGGTKATLKLRSSWAGKRVTVQVFGRKSGYVSTDRTAKSVKVAR